MKIILISIFFYFNALYSQNSIIDFFIPHVKSFQKSLENNSKPVFKIKDTENGFYSYDLNSFGITGFEEMAYYISQKGNKFVAITSFGCGPLCGCDFPKFFELNGDILVDKTQKYFPSTLKSQIVKKLEAQKSIILKSILEQIYKETGTELTENDIPLAFWVKLPQKGTTIKFGFMEGAEENGKFYSIVELKYDSVSGLFSM